MLNLQNLFIFQEGETETENPFEIDVMKDNIPEEPEKEQDENKQDNKNGLEVSSDDEDENDADEHDTKNTEVQMPFYVRICSS